MFSSNTLTEEPQSWNIFLHCAGELHGLFRPASQRGFRLHLWYAHARTGQKRHGPARRIHGTQGEIKGKVSWDMFRPNRANVTCFLSSLPLLPPAIHHGSTWLLSVDVISLVLPNTVSPVRPGLAYPYDWKGFVWAKKKASMGLVVVISVRAFLQNIALVSLWVFVWNLGNECSHWKFTPCIFFPLT